MNKIISHFRMAKKISRKSDLKSAKVGACLVVKGSIYTTCNTRRTHPQLPLLYGVTFSTHAEARVIFSAREHSPSEIYVYREDKEGNIRNARPCKGCLGLIVSVGIRKIYYSINNKHYGLIKNNGMLEEFSKLVWDNDTHDGKPLLMR